VKPQISPLRYAPVEMTILFESEDIYSQAKFHPSTLKAISWLSNKLVISTGA
jgi:hypothetical protein